MLRCKVKPLPIRISGEMNLESRFWSRKKSEKTEFALDVVSRRSQRYNVWSMTWSCGRNQQRTLDSGFCPTQRTFWEI